MLKLKDFELQESGRQRDRVASRDPPGQPDGPQVHDGERGEIKRMEGKDPLLWRDKGKRKKAWGNKGLYLDNRKTLDQDGERSNL